MKVVPYSCQTIEDDDLAAVTAALKSDFLTTGPCISEFEDLIKEACGAKYAVAVTNGTAALHLPALCLLEKGDKVLTTPNSFLATANAILYVGAEPVFVDTDAEGNLDLELCEQYLQKNPGIKGIFAVHFAGKVINQDKLAKLQQKYNIIILEDASHSFGGHYLTKDNLKITAGSCTYSNCTTFSFHPVKLFTTGEGGAITTNDQNLYKKLLRLRNHGMTREKSTFINHDMAFDSKQNVNPWYYEMQELGYNYRLTDFQCALGISQLKKLDKFTGRRLEIARQYEHAFQHHPLVKPLHTFDAASAYHLYVLRINFAETGMSRAEFMQKLREEGIGSQVHYIPINKQPFYRSLGYGEENTPQMDTYYQQCLSIPLFPKLTDEQVKMIIEVINRLTRK